MEELELSEFALSALIGAVEGVWALLLIAAQQRFARRTRVAQQQPAVAPEELHLVA